MDMWKIRSKEEIMEEAKTLGISTFIAEIFWLTVQISSPEELVFLVETAEVLYTIPRTIKN